MIWAAIALAIIFALYAFAQRNPQDLPWTPLDLGEPIGAFTGRKLAALTTRPQQCRVLLDRAGVRYRARLPIGGDQCGYRDGVMLQKEGSRTIGFSPGALQTSCPVAAALAIWEWEVVQPAAYRHLKSHVRTIEHFGSYSCRRLYGRAEGGWSEHATADAFDVAGFIFDDGSRITIARDWNGSPNREAFLREVRDGACRLFSTVLSPDYNRAHADHLHLDQAERGATGWRACT